MHSLSNNLRRATQDIDFDFIKYSLQDKSIRNFIYKLNLVNDGIVISIDEPIIELRQQDYHGKRINLKITDKKYYSVYTKLDIGVHNRFDIKQEEYCFSLDAMEDVATLIINSKEQIIGEKLKSLLKFGILSTRYKDIFDFYYLINNFDIDKNELLDIIDILIFKDENMRQEKIEDIVYDLNLILNDRRYNRYLDNVKNNWLNIKSNIVIKSVLSFFESLNVVLI